MYVKKIHQFLSSTKKMCTHTHHTHTPALSGTTRVSRYQKGTGLPTASKHWRHYWKDPLRRKLVPFFLAGGVYCLFTFWSPRPRCSTSLLLLVMLAVMLAVSSAYAARPVLVLHPELSCGSCTVYVISIATDDVTECVVYIRRLCYRFGSAVENKHTPV